MPTVLDRVRDAAATYETKVDEQIAQATSRIRLHDVAFGGLALGSLVAAYAVGMVILDRYLNLSPGVRQLAFAGFLLAAGVVGYFALVRPLRRRINPLYAAVRVEKTIADSKNSVAGYVELKERELNPVVKAALGAKAARAVGKADLARAVDHKSLVYFGGVLATLAVSLIVLFFVFRPAPFASLLRRAFVPFSSGTIVQRTQIAVVTPEGGDAVVPKGRPIAVAVTIGGKVPSADKPDRPRLLVRNNPVDPNYDELPLEPGADRREWSVTVPDLLVQNGFWYKVAAGDAETPEYHVTVRTAPLFTDFEATYEYPAYLRMKPDVGRSERLDGYAGTKVVLAARTNREVRDGRMVVAYPTGKETPPREVAVPGTPVAGRPDTLAFALTLEEAGSYKLFFTAKTGEASGDHTPYPIQIYADEAPVITIGEPKDPETAQPANGQLAIDAKVGDDFGVDAVTLRLRLAGERPRPLAAKPFNGGKSFRREGDGTYPKSVDYKDSVDLSKLTDEAGQPVEVVEGDALEFWLEATDNRQPKPNVGRSAVQRLKVLAPRKDEDARQDVEQQKQNRKAQEGAANKAEQARLNEEKRDPNPGPRQQAPDAPKPGDAPPQGEKEKGENGQKPPAGAEQNPGDARKPPENGNAGGNDPQGKPANGAKPGGPGDPAQPPMPGGNDAGTPPPAGDQQPDNKAVLDEADKVKEKIEEEKQGAGGAKGGTPPPASDKPTDPAQAKAPPDGGQPGEGASEPKGGKSKGASKPDGSDNPQGAAEPKGEGNPPQPPKPSEGKDGPKPDVNEKANPQPQDGNGGAGESKAEPKDKGQAGGEKAAPKGDASNQNKPSDGGSGKGEAPKSDQGGNDSAPKNETGGNQAGEPKPSPNADRGKGRESGSKAGGAADEKPPENDNAAGTGKGDKAPKAGDAKPSGKGGTKPEAAESKEPPAENKGGENPSDPGKEDPSEDKTESGGGKPGSSPKKGADKGAGKSSDPGELAREAGRKKDQQSNAPRKQNPKDGPEELRRKKEFEDTARDMNSPDAGKRQQAQEKMKQDVGEQGAKDAAEAAKGLDSQDAATKEKAEKDLEGLSKKKKPEADAKNAPNGGSKNAGEAKPGDDANGANAGGPKPTKEQADELKKKVDGLASKDPATKEQAEKDFDKSMGKDQREAVQKAINGQKGGDDQKAQAGRDKIDELAKKDGKPAGGSGDAPQEPKLTKEKADDLAKKAGGLASDDKETREKAEKEFDDALGKEKREQLQNAMKEQKDKGAGGQEKEARKQLDPMAKDADKNAQKGKGGDDKKPLTPQEREKLAKDLRDLASANEKDKKAAEKSLDDRVGKDAREKAQANAQQVAKDLQSADPDKRKAAEEEVAEARKQLEELARNNPGRDDPVGNDPPNGTGGSGPPVKAAMKDDPKNRIKSAELQLEEFKKNEFNKDLHEKMGWSQEQYDRFVKGYEEMVGKMRQEATAPERPKADATTPPPPPTVNVDGAGKVEARSAGESGLNAGGPTFAPPGFEKAKEQFSREAKQRTPKK